MFSCPQKLEQIGIFRGNCHRYCHRCSSDVLARNGRIAHSSDGLITLISLTIPNSGGDFRHATLAAVMMRAELRGIRTELGWSVREAAERLGVTPRTYRYYESGVSSSGRPAPAVPRTVAIAMLAFRFVRQHPEAALAGDLGDEGVVL
jgi:DNA-binding XRE family transcriptional regulator